MLHFHQFGWLEGRDPSSAFSTSGYLAANPDVAAAGVDPLAHYLQYGRNENRQIVPVVDNSYIPTTSYRGYNGSGQTIVIIDDGYSTLYGNELNLVSQFDFGDLDRNATSHGLANCTRGKLCSSQGVCRW